jgi:serine/threonine protein kinase
VLGTAFYMSPEQAQSFPDIDGRTDLFSLGAILYEMLTGEPPHSAPTYEAVLIAICTRDAPDVRSKAPDVPEKLARVIARALQRERAERYASAVDMLEDLDAVQRESRALATKTRSVAGVWAQAPNSSQPERYRTLVYAIVAGLAGFSVAAYFVARAAPTGPEPHPGALPVAADSSLSTAPSAHTPSLPATAMPAAGTDDRPKARVLPGKSHEAVRPAPKKPPPAASAGVAGSLGLSTREP